jgi:hypothetical protein
MTEAKLRGSLYYGYTHALGIGVSLYNNKRVIGQEETGYRPSPTRSRL